MKAIKNMAERFRPREKLLRSGVEALTESELLAILLGSGRQKMNVLEISKKSWTKIENLADLIKKNDLPSNQAFIKAISNLPGIATIQASKILASLELGRRFYDENKVSKIDSPEKVFQNCFEIRQKKQEYAAALYLNGKQELLKNKILAIGGFNYNFLEARQIFETAFECKAASFILVHNHPSGNLIPSSDDLLLTEKVFELSENMGIKLTDHIVLSKDNYYSIRQKYPEIFSV
jgi:DNA repair protein RadC